MPRVNRRLRVRRGGLGVAGRYGAARRMRRAAQVGRLRMGRYGRYQKSRRWRLYKNVLSLNSLRTNLVYYDTITLNPSTNALTNLNGAIWQFRINSCYDPDYTGAGHQPMYHDNYSALFQKYRVIASKISVRILENKIGGVVPNDADAGSTDVPSTSYRLLITKDEGLGFPNDMRNAIEERGSNMKWRYITPQLMGRPQGLSHSCKVAQLLRCASNDPDLAGLTGGIGTGSNPAREAFWTIGIVGVDGVTDPPNVVLGVQISYRIEYFDRQLVQNQN